MRSMLFLLPVCTALITLALSTSPALHAALSQRAESRAATLLDSDYTARLLGVLAALRVDITAYIRSSRALFALLVPTPRDRAAFYKSASHLASRASASLSRLATNTRVLLAKARARYLDECANGAADCLDRIVRTFFDNPPPPTPDRQLRRIGARRTLAIEEETGACDVRAAATAVACAASAAAKRFSLALRARVEHAVQLSRKARAVALEMRMQAVIVMLESAHNCLARHEIDAVYGPLPLHVAPAVLVRACGVRAVQKLRVKALEMCAGGWCWVGVTVACFIGLVLCVRRGAPRADTRCVEKERNLLSCSSSSCSDDDSGSEEADEYSEDDEAEELCMEEYGEEDSDAALVEELRRAARDGTKRATRLRRRDSEEDGGREEGSERLSNPKMAKIVRVRYSKT